MYKSIPDNRDTSNGMTPAKSISRPTNPTVKPIIGDYNKTQPMRKSNVSMDKTSDQ